MEIRNYKKSDYPQVKSVLEDANLFDSVWDGEDNLAGMIKSDKQNILVAVEDDRVVGNLFICPFGSKVAYLFRLAVLKEYRNRGVATKLISEAEKVCKNKGMQEISLFFDKDNPELFDFYSKRKFVTSDRKQAYYCFWKELK